MPFAMAFASVSVFVLVPFPMSSSHTQQEEEEGYKKRWTPSQYYPTSVYVGNSVNGAGSLSHHKKDRWA